MTWNDGILEGWNNGFKVKSKTGYLGSDSLPLLQPGYFPDKIKGMESQQILILGIGNILFSDEGFGVHVVHELQKHYAFPDHVSVVDGGVLGLNLLGIISTADRLIVIDAIQNGQKAGTLYRLEGDAIPERIRAKNSLHQIDFLEALTLCQALDKVPETVILGVEPMDIGTPCEKPTSVILSKVDPIIRMVLAELNRLGVSYHKRSTA